MPWLNTWLESEISDAAGGMLGVQACSQLIGFESCVRDVAQELPGLLGK
jgi:hypothetical protein